MASQAPVPGGWTYGRYLELDDEKRYEILDGALIMVPAPDIRHQDILRDLSFRITEHVVRRGSGKVLFAPTDVVLAKDQVVQPDILVVRRERLEIVGEQAVIGAPDLVVEILSPSSVYRDRHEKRALYRRAGVAEYWIVDPADLSVEVLKLGGNGYDRFSRAAGAGVVTSAALPGFAVEVAEIFGSPPPGERSRREP